MATQQLPASKINNGTKTEQDTVYKMDSMCQILFSGMHTTPLKKLGLQLYRT